MSDKSEPGTLGFRMKEYEQPSTSRRAFKGQPLIVRLDGKNFHSFCRGLQRPFDARLSELMVSVTKSLVDRFQARVGYTQSDEISLAWHIQPHETEEFQFGGRFQKLESLTAAYCSVAFNKALATYLPEKQGEMPIFDSRAFVVPTLTEAYHAFLWRQQDATKNAISMAAQSMFSHKSLQGLHGPEMQEKMWKEKGVNFNDYPYFFKRGTFVKREKVLVQPGDLEMESIPEKFRPTTPVQRTRISSFDCWLSRQDHPVSVLFGEGITRVTPETPKEQG